MKSIVNSANDLMLFTYLVEHESFTALAEILQVNKSVISKRISQLERQLGTQLFIRSTRRLSLTDAGKLLYKRCEVLKKDFAEIHAELSDLTNEPQGTLRISSPNNFAQEHLTPLIAEFMQLYPLIKFKLFIGRSYRCLVKNSIDLGFHVGALQDSNWVARKLTTRRMIVCATPEYLARAGTPQTPDQLSQHNCLCFMEDSSVAHWTFHQAGMPSKQVEVKGNFKTTSVQVLKAAVLQHMGFAMLPGHIITRELKIGQLVAPFKSYETDHLDIFALYAHKSHLPQRARLFMDFVADKFASLDYWQYR